MSDLHAQGEYFLLPEEEFDCLLLCGDNAETDTGFPYHHALFKDIREQFSGLVGFVVGNHDLWAPGGWNSWEILYNKMPELAERYDLHYLETENLVIDDWTIAGTYGHYDYGFGRVSEEIARKGEYNSSQGRLSWIDIKQIKWGEREDLEVCRTLLNRFSQRLEGTNREKLITISHTIPHRSLVGHPNSEIERFFSCYSGSKRLGDILRAQGGVAHYCGHTHAEARARLGQTDVVNIGNDFGKRKYSLFDSELLK